MPSLPAVIGGSNIFLTKLAAQERLVLELREELEKAENELSGLKKQWAQHEAVKKRNEFRQQAQLEQLRSKIRFHEEVDERPNPRRASIDRPDRPNEGTATIDSIPCQNSLGKLCLSSNTKKTQRKIFAGSRHTRTLSLLSISSGPQKFPNQQADGSPSPDLNDNRRSTVTFHDTQRSTMQSILPPLTHQEPENGKPKEVFLETGKQLVGDLREGLWTFFEDLRQATVGEEASSTSNHGSKVRPFGRPDIRMKDDRRDEVSGMLQKTGKRLNEPQPLSTPRPRAAKDRLFAKKATEKEKRPVREQIQPNKFQIGVVNPSAESDEGESWDVWDTPVAKASVARKQSESIMSEPLVSPSTSGCSPRSSMSSLDSTPFSLPSQISPVPQGDIPWPVIENLSRGNSRMTATSLMSEWEKSLAKSMTTNAALVTRTNSLVKNKKAD